MSHTNFSLGEPNCDRHHLEKRPCKICAHPFGQVYDAQAVTGHLTPEALKEAIQLAPALPEEPVLVTKAKVDAAREQEGSPEPQVELHDIKLTPESEPEATEEPAPEQFEAEGDDEPSLLTGGEVADGPKKRGRKPKGAN